MKRLDDHLKVIALLPLFLILAALPVTLIFAGEGDDGGDGLITITKSGNPPVIPPIGPTLLPGWPQGSNGRVRTAPAVADLDGDGTLEVVVGSEAGYLSAFHADGTPVAGWPRQLGSSVGTSPNIADLDGDGTLEVVAGTFGGCLYAFHADGTTVGGWRRCINNSFGITTQAVGDLDGDGTLEVVAGSLDGYVYVFHADGTPVPGWSQHVGNYYWGATPTIADLDGDGTLEVVEAIDNEAYVFHADGSIVAGWPQWLSSVIETPHSVVAVGDLDGDGTLEVVVGSGAPNGYVYAFHADGTIVPGWPQDPNGWKAYSPVLADLDGDGTLEVVVGTTDGRWEGDITWVYAYHGNGSIVAGWPQSSTGHVIATSPAIADLDGDGTLEVVVGNPYNRLVHAFHADGSIVSGWPLDISGIPAIADLDRNGTLEVVVGSSDHQVYAWTLPWISRSTRTPWPMYRQNRFRTGRFNLAPILNPIGTQYAPINSFLIFQISAQDPDQDRLTYSATHVPVGATFYPSTRTFVWPRTPRKIGTYSVTFTVTDSSGATDSEEVQIKIVRTGGMPPNPIEIE